MSGDIIFEPELQRCISTDIRYVLFIIDKYAGAGYLVNEMTLVENEKTTKEEEAKANSITPLKTSVEKPKKGLKSNVTKKEKAY